MAFAIELYFDKVAESKIRAAWSELAEATFPAWPLRIGARPHVSILILDSGSRTKVEELFRNLVAFDPFTVMFTVADYFDGKDSTIFLKPDVSESLRRLHYLAVKDSQARSMAPRHSGDEWIPHCTCDYRVNPTKLPVGLLILNRHLPLEARVEEIGCVEVTPTSVLRVGVRHVARP
jgi:hypothetical protein